MVFGTGAILLAYLTVQRLVELWWAKQNEARLMASGGIEYGHAHLPLMILFHPGGRKLIETMQDVLGLEREQLEHSWEVLRAYGNMSSATALFVLDRALKAGARGPHLLAAFGPGFSAYFVAADL